MASLRNIMNVDDDHPDSDSLKKDTDSRPNPSQQHLGSSSHLTGYQQQPDLSNTLPPSQLQRGTSSSSSYALPSLTPEQHPSSASPGFPSSGSTSRRRSNTSTDSMDSPYMQGYASMVSSTGGSMRHAGPGVPGADMPLKLTPVTGKPSRAKKGHRVHICEECRPPKTFTRAEHLRRHALSHGPADKACPVRGCGKVFHRQDLLDRHQQRHEQEDRTPTSTTSEPGHALFPPGASTPYSPPFVPSPASQEPGKGQHSIWDQPPPNQGSLSSPSDFPNSGPGGGLGFGSMPPSYDHHTFLTPNPPELMHIDVETWDDSSSDAYSDPSATDDHRPGHWGLQTPFPSVASRSPIMDSYHPLHGFTASHEVVQTPVFCPDLMPEFGGSSLISSPPNPMNLVGSFPPQLAADQTSETLVPSTSALSTHRLATSQGGCEGQHETAVFNLLMTKEMMPVFMSPTVRSVIPDYLETYWNKVHPVYPIIHRETLNAPMEIDPEYADVLRCAMSCVAAQFCDGKDARIHGDQLFTYAWEKLKVFTQPDNWPLPIMQTVLLCEYYARFRGRKKASHQPSTIFKLLFQKVILKQRVVQDYYASNSPSGVAGWKAWLTKETLNRLIAACFILDVHTVCYYAQPPCAPPGVLDYSSPETLAVPLTTGTMALWEANDAQLWQQQMGSYGGVANVRSAFAQRLTPSKVAAAPAFDASILQAAHALQLRQFKNSSAGMDIGLTGKKLDLANGWAEELPLGTLFAGSACANTYMALHYTPLRALLSVAGESWVFNKKVLDESSFADHRRQLREWRGSEDCHRAVVFATRGLSGFLRPILRTDACGAMVHVEEDDLSPVWQDISDYWGFYVCTLICWAYGHDVVTPTVTVNDAVRWIQASAESSPTPGRRSAVDGRAACGSVKVASIILAKDALGGRNILLADAVSVLKKLEDGISPRF